MSIFNKLFNRSRENKAKAQEYEDNKRIANNSDFRELSHNEREMIKILKREKEEAMREALFWEEKRRQCDERKKARSMMTSNIFKKEKDDFLNGGFF